MDNTSRHTVQRLCLLYITAYMRGTPGMSRDQRTNIRAVLRAATVYINVLAFGTEDDGGLSTCTCEQALKGRKVKS